MSNEQKVEYLRHHNELSVQRALSEIRVQIYAYLQIDATKMHIMSVKHPAVIRAYYLYGIVIDIARTLPRKTRTEASSTHTSRAPNIRFVCT